MWCGFAEKGVRTAAPMKRGLRHVSRLKKPSALSCSNSCPDEEGIETLMCAVSDTTRRCSNSCPDEEGIETSPNPANLSNTSPFEQLPR